MVKTMGLFVRIITLGWAAAITLAPFGIYIKEDYMPSVRILRHELVHWQQQMHLLIVPFYIWYLLEWILKLPFYGKRAYNSISFEREARAYQFDRGYVRSRWSHLRYVFNEG